MRELGKAREGLGLQTSGTSPSRKLWLNQNTCVTTILNQFQMEESSRLDWLMEYSMVLENELAGNHLASSEQFQIRYREDVGSSMSLMIGSCPDTTYAFGQQSSFVCHQHQHVRWNAFKGVLQNINRTHELGICSSGYRQLYLNKFSKFDWAGHTRDKKLPR